MPVTPASELNAAQRDLVTRARDAMNSRNYGYTITLMQGLLKAVPLFVDGRHLLRAACIQQYKEQGGMAKKMSSAKASAKAMTLSTKKEPAEVMAQAEEVLAVDPYNARANQVLADAARKLECLEIASMSYETIKEGSPKDNKNLHTLGDVYMEMGLPDKAETVYGQIVDQDPSDGEAKSKMKNASAANASKTGNWEAAEEAGDFRKALGNEEEAISLERQSKVVKGEAAIREQINEVYALSEQQPENLTHLKKMAQLYAQLEEFESAIQWYEYAYDKGGRTDGAIEKIIDDLRLQAIDKRIRELRPKVAADPSLQEQMTALEHEKLQVRVDTAQRRVERYPNDYQFHYDYGKALFDMGDYKTALKELQLGTKQPNVRIKALELIGLCHWHGGRYDMAKDSLEKAMAELPVMDGAKMDVTYHLAQLCEGTGESERSIDLYKQIYEVDMGYRDVAEKVEASYQT